MVILRDYYPSCFPRNSKNYTENFKFTGMRHNGAAIAIVKQQINAGLQQNYLLHSTEQKTNKIKKYPNNKN